jgi:excinuclease UvrABC ATPase subunit
MFININNKESQTCGGHRCSYCQGNGFFWKVNEDVKERLKETCPVCKGSKTLKAVVTIEWLPEKNIQV